MGPRTISVYIVPQLITKFMIFIKHRRVYVRRELRIKFNVLLFQKFNVTSKKTSVCIKAIICEQEQVNLSLFHEIDFFWYTAMEIWVDKLNVPQP